MTKIIKKGGLWLLFLLLLGLPSFASYIYGTVNSGSPAAGEVTFVAYRDYDDEIVTEGVDGGNDYGAFSSLTGATTNIWYFQESSFLPTNLGVDNPWHIYFHYGAGSSFGSDSGTWTGGNDNAGNTTLSSGSNPASPEVVLTSGDGFVGFHLPTDTTTYRIYRSDNASNRSYVRIDGGSAGATSSVGAYYKDATVTNGTTYYYVVVRQNSSGSTTYSSFSAHSARVSCTPETDGVPGAPAAPTAVSATAGNIEISLSWAANTEDDVYYYKIYRDGVYLSTVYYAGIDTATYSYTDTTVYWGTSYTYKITAVDFSSNESTYSSDVTASPYDTGAPTASGTMTPFSGLGNSSGGVVYTKNAQVHLSVTGTENTLRSSQQSGIEQYKAWDYSLSDPGYSTFSGAAVNTSPLTQSDVYGGLTLSTVTEGSKTIRIQVKDFAGNESAAESKTAWYDITAPTLSSVVLNGGDAYTNSSTVSLTWDYTDNCTDTTHCLNYWWDSETEPTAATTGYSYSASAHSTTVTFPSTGAHTLHLKVIDLATNTSSQVDSNTVTYDTSTITGTLTIEGGAVSTLSSEVSLTLGTNKPSVKSSSYYYINNDLDAVVDQTASGSGWTAWPADDVITGWSLGIVDPTAYGFKFVYMRLKDPSSNVSDVVTASIYYGEVGLGAQTFLVTLESNYPAGPGINTLAMPFAAPWYVFNSSGTALLYDGVTNEVRTAYDLVQAVNAAAGTGSNVVSTFGKWDPTGQYANGVLIGTSIDGDEATRLAAISLEQGKGYQVYMRQNNVQMMIKNVAE